MPNQTNTAIRFEPGLQITGTVVVTRTPAEGVHQAPLTLAQPVVLHVMGGPKGAIIADAVARPLATAPLDMSDDANSKLPKRKRAITGTTASERLGEACATMMVLQDVAKGRITKSHKTRVKRVSVSSSTWRKLEMTGNPGEPWSRQRVLDAKGDIVQDTRWTWTRVGGGWLASNLEIKGQDGATIQCKFVADVGADLSAITVPHVDESSNALPSSGVFGSGDADVGGPYVDESGSEPISETDASSVPGGPTDIELNETAPMFCSVGSCVGLRIAYGAAITAWYGAIAAAIAICVTPDPLIVECEAAWDLVDAAHAAVAYANAALAACVGHPVAFPPGFDVGYD